MEGGESLLDTLFDVGSVGDAEDVDMLDVEEGELTEQISRTGEGELCDVGGSQVNEESNKRNSRNRRKKKKNKRKRGSSDGPNITNINRFVLDTCKRFREKKSYLMWTAVGCLGVSALSDLVKEVDAIQACGGQKTADGSRFRNGGGILWNIIKARDPNAYKEIMSKGKEFEKQFKQQLNGKQGSKQQAEGSSKTLAPDTNPIKFSPSDDLELTHQDQTQVDELPTTVQKRASVHERIRVPVSYDDLLEGENPKDEFAPTE